jgi:hypothetical protein
VSDGKDQNAIFLRLFEEQAIGKSADANPAEMLECDRVRVGIAANPGDGVVHCLLKPLGNIRITCGVPRMSFAQFFGGQPMKADRDH